MVWAMAVAVAVVAVVAIRVADAVVGVAGVVAGVVVAGVVVADDVAAGAAGSRGRLGVRVLAGGSVVVVIHFVMNHSGPQV